VKERNKAGAGLDAATAQIETTNTHPEPTQSNEILLITIARRNAGRRAGVFFCQQQKNFYGADKMVLLVNKPG